jgi:hypothetical protein
MKLPEPKKKKVAAVVDGSEPAAAEVAIVEEENTDPYGERYAKKVVGRSCYVDWPYLKECLVMSASDGEQR